MMVNDDNRIAIWPLKNIILLRTKGMVVPCLLLIDSYMKWLAIVMKHYRVVYFIIS